MELLAVKFKEAATLDQFQRAFEQCVRAAQEGGASGKTDTSVQDKPAPFSVAVDPSKWECKACFVRNAKDADTCVCCGSDRNGNPPALGTGPLAPPAPAGFSFGLVAGSGGSAQAASGDGHAKTGLLGDKPAKNTFSFGIAQLVSPQAAKPDSGTSASDTVASPSSDTFGTPGTAEDTPADNASFSSAKSGGFGSFSFGLGERNTFSSGSFGSLASKAPVAATDSKKEEKKSVFESFSFAAPKKEEQGTPGSQSSGVFGSTPKTASSLGSVSSGLPLSLKPESEQADDCYHEQDDYDPHYEPVMDLPPEQVCPWFSVHRLHLPFLLPFAHIPFIFD